MTFEFKNKDKNSCLEHSRPEKDNFCNFSLSCKFCFRIFFGPKNSAITYYDSKDDTMIPTTKVFIREKVGQKKNRRRKRRNAAEKVVPKFPEDVEVGEIGDIQERYKSKMIVSSSYQIEHYVKNLIL